VADWSLPASTGTTVVRDHSRAPASDRRQAANHECAGCNRPTLKRSARGSPISPRMGSSPRASFAPTHRFACAGRDLSQLPAPRKLVESSCSDRAPTRLLKLLETPPPATSSSRPSPASLGVSGMARMLRRWTPTRPTPPGDDQLSARPSARQDPRHSARAEGRSAPRSSASLHMQFDRLAQVGRTPGGARSAHSDPATAVAPLATPTRADQTSARHRPDYRHSPLSPRSVCDSPCSRRDECSVLGGRLSGKTRERGHSATGHPRRYGNVHLTNAA